MRRILTRLTGVPVVLAVLFSAKLGFARSKPPEEERYRFDIGGRFHVLAASNVGALGAGADVGYRILPALSTGLFVQLAAGTTLSGDTCAYEGLCFKSSYRFGAAAAVHPVQNHILDPWFGVTAGPSFHDSGSTHIDPSQEGAYHYGWSFDLSFDLGLDVRFSGPFGVGIYLMTMPALTDHRPWWNAVGLRASSSF